MKFIIVFVALFAMALASPSDVEIVRQSLEVEPENYRFDFETSDGTNRHEEGVVKDAGSDHAALNVNGVYSYKDGVDGVVYTVNYIANENGFQPQGEHLPK